MRRLSTFLAVTALLALVVPASAAGWADLSTNFTAAGLGSGTGLISDTSTNTLYAMKGTTLMQYNAGADSWTAKTSATGIGYRAGDPYGSLFCVGGKILLRDKGVDYIEIYDIAADTWSQSTLPGDTYDHGWGQGAVYSPVDGGLHIFWTSHPNPFVEPVGATYNVATGVWTERDTLYTGLGPMYLWARMQNVTVGETNYFVRDEDYFIGQNVTVGIYDLNLGFPTDAGTYGQTYSTRHDLGAGNQLAAASTGQFGVQCMAVHGTDIYFSGMEDSGIFVKYDTLTGTWTDLTGYANADGNYRDHSTSVAGSVVYVQDNNEFFAYDIPEPATMSLLCCGGIGLLIRRKR